MKYRCLIKSYEVGPRDDGDTFKVTVDLGWHAQLTTRVRLLGVDAPELSVAAQKKAALIVRAKVIAWLAGWSCDSQYRLWLDSLELDQYGRTLGDVVVESRAEGEEKGVVIASLVAYLLAIGAVVPYEGRRHAWTDVELSKIEKLQAPSS